ncbi:MAG: hypothetical protein WKG07_32170 [Hymenobacter sp.]
MAEEFELVRTLRAQQARVLGLDQIFIANAAPTYRQLAGQVKNKASPGLLCTAGGNLRAPGPHRAPPAASP